MKRRRFISLAACFAALPGAGWSATWNGRGLGADVSIQIEGPRAEVKEALKRVPKLISDVEARFSLYDANSELSRLNRTGGLVSPSSWMTAILESCDKAHRMTGGLFDPTVQPLWHALATGGDVIAAREVIGWSGVGRSDLDVRLGVGQALTLNGIAQGFATDLMRATLTELGAVQALVNLGEHASLGGPYRIGISDPQAGIVGWRSLKDGALASSSPASMQIASGQAHIISPDGRAPLWSTVSIEAANATLADALSTAAVFMTEAELTSLKQSADLAGIVTVNTEGDVRRY